ncbi:MAG: MotA/TolQ/ExbB proton channel family protein [Oscillospiraceae bacterium]|nr:MotA/TolQ/ExbB proton channel family protein [Oscillospiraceae bacterium]
MILIILAACVLILTGATIGEYFVERRHLKVVLPQLVDDICHAVNITAVLERSGLLNRQNAALLEITKHPYISADSRTALAIRLVESEEAFYSSRVKCSDLIAKLSPMFGLLGTLIPLGPGIIALGQGDTYTLSLSLLTAFDTTVVGLIVAAIAVVISAVRKKWYTQYIADIKLLMENTLEAVEKQ